MNRMISIFVVYCISYAIARTEKCVFVTMVHTERKEKNTRSWSIGFAEALNGDLNSFQKPKLICIWQGLFRGTRLNMLLFLFGLRGRFGWNWFGPNHVT